MPGLPRTSPDRRGFGSPAAHLSLPTFELRDGSSLPKRARDGKQFGRLGHTRSALRILPPGEGDLSVSIVRLSGGLGFPLRHGKLESAWPRSRSFHDAGGQIWYPCPIWSEMVGALPNEVPCGLTPAQFLRRNLTSCPISSTLLETSLGGVVLKRFR